MKYFEEDDPVAEVHRIRAEMLEEYGGIEGYIKHLDEDLPRLIAEGWKIVTPKEIKASGNINRNYCTIISG
jgi:hypothetical protein